MAHRLRDTLAGRFHVYTHCVWATPEYFRDTTDRLVFLRYLARATTKSQWTCIAFCLMTSHYHLILEVDDNTLPAAMQSLNHAYACSFNRRYGLRGHVQFRRYGARRICGDFDLLGTFAYVSKNPVAAGVCRRPENWSWSSYAGTIGRSEPATFVDDSALIDCFNLPPFEARDALRRYVEES